MSETLTREEFASFLWDNGVNLPFPLRLGPAGPVPVAPGRAFDAEVALRRRLWSPAMIRRLDGLLWVMRAPESVAFAYVVLGEEDVAESRRVTAGIVRGNDAVVVEESPECVRLSMVPWSQVTSAVAASVPQMLGVSLPRMFVPQEGILAMAQAAESGLSERARERASVAAGVPAGVEARLEDLVSRSVIRGFVGAGCTVGGEQMMSPVSGDFFAAPDGGFIGWGDDSGMTVEPVSTGVLARVLGVALSRL
ncbi:hypothetical protein SAMN05421595_3039 [Austwickia chelonae]|uniref:ESX secretion-associated protein EspG n=1 Tax=Austwickia chelonae NBRC 105200 TaxID=1184607 RepID=K6VAZ6_9MICO|nr:hypothetical protein [Austwickia chelonae]GAB79418.1 hypothetical protein AUCHE_24_00730 [Austwickia chelonae NBRC 105200]SEW43370.1 hypothetical protein SAMN05421595_3039 [Austwickia chelonae]